MKIRRSKSQKVKTQASEIARDDRRLHELAQNALKKAHQHRDKMPGFWIDLKILIRLIKAWASREYRVIPWKSLITIIGALLYFVNPLDLLPDFLLFGFIDDAIVIAKVLSSLKEDLGNFLLWEKTIEIES